MNYIPHLLPKSAIKFQGNRVYFSAILGRVKPREELLFLRKKLLG